MFKQDVLNKKASLNDIDDYIDEWHRGNSELSLSEYLGLTKNEYAQWVENPNCLFTIIYGDNNNEQKN